MNEGLIPKRYAKALYKFALEKGDAQKLYDLMGTLSRSFTQNPGLDTTVGNPFVDAGKKVELLMTAAGATPADGVYSDFLKLLCRNNRLEMTAAIARAYLEIYRKANNIYLVDVVAASPMDPKEEKRLKDMIASHLNGGTMEYSFSVDPELIGGFTVNIDSERLDASVKNELKQLRLKLLKK